MTQDDDKIEILNPDPAKKGARVDRATYEVYRAAVLAAIPVGEEGIALADLSDAVVPHVDPAVLERAPVGWWVMAAKLDLEARKVIERVPGKGRQRLRHATT